MRLLDLPPEVFQRVVRVLVKKHGLVEAWKVRGTSKTFRTLITYEVLATPSLYAYNKSCAGRKILKNNLADFLFVRSSTLNHFARPHVPTFIGTIMLVMKPWITGDEATSTLRKVLCELFVRHHADALKCVLTDINKLNKFLREGISSTNTVTLVAAAAATGNLDALRHFAKENKQSLWKRSPAFGYPLDAAVHAGHLGIVKAIARQAITNQNPDVMDIHQGHAGAEHVSFRQGICTGIESQHRDIVAYLLKKYVKAFGPATEACMASWLEKAITCDHKDMLLRLIHVPTQAGASTFYEAFKTVCHLSKPSLLYIFFRPLATDLGHLSINQVYGSTYPLLTAIEKAKPKHINLVVKELLKLGADANGPKYLAGLDRPLRTAWSYDHGGTFLTLLEAGANPWLVFSDGFIMEILMHHGKRTRTGKALRIACRKFERLKPKKEVEGFLAEVKE